MNNTILNDKFIFSHLRFNEYHYTDNRKGSPMNYLAYMIKGHAKIVSNHKTITVNEGDVFFIPKELSYQSYWYGNNEISFLSFGFSELGTKENTKFDLQTIPSNIKLINKLVSIPTNGNKVKCKGLSIFYDVMSDVIPYLTYPAESKDEMTVDKIKRCIRSHPHCSLSEIANMCTISQPYLYSLFKKIAHITPNDYRQKVLCEMGVDLLSTTDKKVEEIADMLGFSSSSYFRKVLKKHTKSTPRELRKKKAF